jgi:hypothetical protein
MSHARTIRNPADLIDRGHSCHAGRISPCSSMRETIPHRIDSDRHCLCRCDAQGVPCGWAPRSRGDRRPQGWAHGIGQAHALQGWDTARESRVSPEGPKARNAPGRAIAVAGRPKAFSRIPERFPDAIPSHHAPSIRCRPTSPGMPGTPETASPSIQKTTFPGRSRGTVGICGAAQGRARIRSGPDACPGRRWNPCGTGCSPSSP